jgi:predicted DNA-binding transcriptional regulator AlpA
MTKTTDLPAILTWKLLKALGHPFSRTHTVRKMADTIELVGARGREVKVIPNPDPFPKARKLGPFDNSPLVWVTSEVQAYYEKHGVKI